MRLWHQDLIPYLPRQQLLGQHRECCALRGNGWGKSHSTVNYVFNYSLRELFEYHLIVMNEMERRNYQVAADWKCLNYRGKSIGYIDLPQDIIYPINEKVYSEHDEHYLNECIENLKKKGIEIDLLLPNY